MNNQESFSWTEESVQTLKDMYAAGSSGGDIARELNGPTRNAIMGKLFRLGINRKAMITEPSPQRRRRVKKVVWFTAMTVKSDFYKFKDPPALPEKASVSPVHFLELKANHCRFPLDNSLYCGIQVVHGKSWCPAHFRYCTTRRS